MRLPNLSPDQIQNKQEAPARSCPTSLRNQDSFLGMLNAHQAYAVATVQI